MWAQKAASSAVDKASSGPDLWSHDSVENKSKFLMVLQLRIWEGGTSGTVTIRLFSVPVIYSEIGLITAAPIQEGLKKVVLWISTFDSLL